MQLTLLGEENIFPPGFSYYPNFISIDEEKDLLARFELLTFSSFEMHGIEAKRKIIHYGMKYDFLSRKPFRISPPPSWLLDLKERSELFLQKEISQILITQYPVGAPIGWHYDFKDLNHYWEFL